MSTELKNKFLDYEIKFLDREISKCHVLYMALYNLAVLLLSLGMVFNFANLNRLLILGTIIAGFAVLHLASKISKKYCKLLEERIKMNKQNYYKCKHE